MRTEGPTKKFVDLSPKERAEVMRKYREKIARGEIEDPTKYDEKGNIIPKPSTLEPNIFDGLNLSKIDYETGGD